MHEWQRNKQLTSEHISYAIKHTKWALCATRQNWWIWQTKRTPDNSNGTKEMLKKMLPKEEVKKKWDNRWIIWHRKWKQALELLNLYTWSVCVFVHRVPRSQDKAWVTRTTTKFKSLAFFWLRCKKYETKQQRCFVLLFASSDAKH